VILGNNTKINLEVVDTIVPDRKDTIEVEIMTLVINSKEVIIVEEEEVVVAEEVGIMEIIAAMEAIIITDILAEAEVAGMAELVTLEGDFRWVVQE